MSTTMTSYDISTEEDVQNVGDSVKDLGAAAANLGAGAKEQVTNLTDQLRQQATSQLNSQKDQIVDGLETVALLLHQAGEHAQQQDKALIATYVDKAAQQVSTFSESIGQQDLTQVVQTTKDFARREPMLFVGGALVAGFIGARFMRSSAEQAERMSQDQSTNGNGPSEDVDQLAAYDVDQTSPTSSDDTVGEEDFRSEYQTGTFDGLGLEEDGAVTVPDLDRVENL